MEADFFFESNKLTLVWFLVILNTFQTSEHTHLGPFYMEVGDPR